MAAGISMAGRIIGGITWIGASIVGLYCIVAWL